MTLKKLQLTPGISREGTSYSTENGYFDCNNVRFRSGYPEKIGGWTRLCDAQYQGICRTLINWVDFDGDNYLGVGTTQKYYVEFGGVYYDITPVGAKFVSPDTNNCFTTAISSTTVTVTIVAHGAATGYVVTFAGAVAVGGIPATSLNQQFVITVTGPDTFTIVVGVAATSTVAHGGGTSITATFGFVYDPGGGWGTGTWGRGTWGSGLGGPPTVGAQLGLWTNDTFGQDLVIAQRNGAVYYWTDNNGLSTPAKSLIAAATAADPTNGPYTPYQTLQVISSAVQQFVILMGTNGYVPGTPQSPFDPMLVRWSDQANPLVWVPSITNQSGEYRLAHGSTIIMAQITRQEILIWTDSALYSMQYLGTSYVWGFNIMADNISIISPAAAITVNNATYWMGREKFFVYSGRVETLACTLKQYVYDDINHDQDFQIFAGLNPGFNEIWWFYCSADSTTVDSYVVYNYLETIWYSGKMARTAWLSSGMRQNPIAADYNSRLLYHEVGCDDVSGTSPVPINSYIQTSDFDIDDGHNFGFVWRILPDVSFNGSTVKNPYVTMEIAPRVNAGTPYGTADMPIVASSQNYTPPNPPVNIVQEFTGQVYTRMRGRQMAFTISSNSLGVAWTLGATRIDLRPDGRKV